MLRDASPLLQALTGTLLTWVFVPSFFISVDRLVSLPSHEFCLVSMVGVWRCCCCARLGPDRVGFGGSLSHTSPLAGGSLLILFSFVLPTALPYGSSGEGAFIWLVGEVASGAG